MPAPVPAPVRQRIWDLAREGRPAEAIAADLRLSPRTVRHLLARSRRAGGPAPPDYSRCGRPCPAAFGPLREQALALRRLHPGWGARRILVQMAGGRPQAPLPGPAAVCRWLSEAGLAPAPRRRPPQAPPALDPHGVWQMDAAERTPLRAGRQVSWLRLVDEASGAVLLTRVFGQGNWGEVGAAPVQGTLRDAFSHWGRPGALRVDNGVPWVGAKDLPSVLELWLAGLEVGLCRNPPRRPQDNGKVERSQRTARAWAEPGLCDTPEELQRRLEEEDRVQREAYPSCAGLSRMRAFPALLHSGRGYGGPRWEDVCWSLPGALSRLAEACVTRKVGRDGEVMLYDRRHLVGRAWAGEVAEARLDAEGVAWVFSIGGQPRATAAAVGLTAEAIRGLALSGRPGRAARRTQARRAQDG